MSHIDQTASQITGVGSLQGGIGKTLAGTVGRDEVLQHGEAFLEVGKNRVFNDLAAFGTGLLRLGHKATHAGQLADLVLATTSARVEHHVYRVEALVGLCHLLHEHAGQL